MGIIPAPYLKMSFVNSIPQSYYAQRLKIVDMYGVETEYQKYRVYVSNGMLSKISYELYGESYEYLYSDIGTTTITLPIEGQGGQGKGNAQGWQ